MVSAYGTTNPRPSTWTESCPAKADVVRAHCRPSGEYQKESPPKWHVVTNMLDGPTDMDVREPQPAGQSCTIHEAASAEDSKEPVPESVIATSQRPSNDAAKAYQ